MSPPGPLHTPICDLLGCRHPVLQAGMGGVARAELAAALSAAGGFGRLGMVRETPALIAREIDAIRPACALVDDIMQEAALVLPGLTEMGAARR